LFIRLKFTFKSRKVDDTSLLQSERACILGKILITCF